MTGNNEFSRDGQCMLLHLQCGPLAKRVSWRGHERHTLTSCRQAVLVRKGFRSSSGGRGAQASSK